MKTEKLECFAADKNTYVALATNNPDNRDMLFNVLHYRKLDHIEIKIDDNSIILTEKDAKALANWLLHSMKEKRPR